MFRHPEKVISGSLFICLVATVVMEVKAGHKMPRPRAVGAWLIMFGLLGLAGSFGGQAARVASAIAAVFALAAVISGAVGKTIVDGINTAARWLGGGKGGKLPQADTTPTGDTGSTEPTTPLAVLGFARARP